MINFLFENSAIYTSAFSIFLLLFLILFLHLHPFIALLMVATILALMTGISIDNIAPLIESGFGKIIGHIAIILTLGAMIGRMIELSGGTEVIANSLMQYFGNNRLCAALSIAGFILAIAVFFEIAILMLMPVAYGLAKNYQLKLASLSLPMCLIILIVHALLPPHPGMIAVAFILTANIGQILIFGFPVAIITSFILFQINKLFFRYFSHLYLDDETIINEQDPTQETNHSETISYNKTPALWLVILFITLPIGLILSGTCVSLLMDSSSFLVKFLQFLAIPYIALLIDILVCSCFLGMFHGKILVSLTRIFGATVPTIAPILLITGAGGAFATILIETGIGNILASLFQKTGLPILIIAFFLTMLLRGAQGPTTVALVTTAGILSPLIENADLNSSQLALVALAMGAGGITLSHVNDAGFWIVTRMSGMSVANGLKTWTTLTTFAGFTAFLIITGLWNFV